MPSSPVIQQVEPFSSTAVVKFEEPDSVGGVPIIKYRVEWRLPGQEWTGREYSAEGGESQRMCTYVRPSLICIKILWYEVWTYTVAVTF